MKVLSQALMCLILMVAPPVYAAGDPEQGQQRAALCAACHGMDGNSMVAMWPKLAGQHAPYLERQLNLIKSGARPVPEMMGIAASLSEQDMADLSAYYAAQETSPGIAKPEQLELGERIYRAGIAEREVPACMACHGPSGAGNPLAGYPAVAGQHSVYTAKMLTRYVAGETWSDNSEVSKVMPQVAKRLEASEIEALANYIEGLYSAQ